MDAVFLAEDTYARDFLKKLVVRLKEAGLAPANMNVRDLYSSYGKVKKCSPKLGRLVRVAVGAVDRIVIFIDADGADREEVRRETVPST